MSSAPAPDAWESWTGDDEPIARFGGLPCLLLLRKREHTEAGMATAERTLQRVDLGEIDYLTNWYKARYKWIDGQLAK